MVVSLVAGLVAVAVSLDGFGAVDLTGKEVARHTTRVSKSHKARVYFPKGTLVELKTQTPASEATDPVMFLLSDQVDEQRRPVVRKASDDRSVGNREARITHTSSTGEWMTVIVVAYDLAYMGKTQLSVKVGTAAPDVVDIWAGGTVYQTGWRTGDTFTLTGHFKAYSLEDMCKKYVVRKHPTADLTKTEWNDYEMSCRVKNSAGNNIVGGFYQGADVCTAASPYHLTATGDSIVTVYNWINKGNPTCQHVSEAADSYALAVGDWSKVMESCEYSCIYPPYSAPICTPYNCVDVNLPPKALGMDDDSGTGRHFRLTTAEWGSSHNVVIAALSPWITAYKAYYDDPNNPTDDEMDYAALADDECSLKWRDFFEQMLKPGTVALAPLDCPGGGQKVQIQDNAFRPYVRLYHDVTVKDGANDQDQDGLSDKLEAVLGTSPTKRDSDYDGIIDGLEVYGPLLAVLDPNVNHVGKLRPSRYLPFPLYGTDPKVKDVIIEWDEQEHVLSPPAGEDTSHERMRSLEAAGETLALSGINLINILGGPNRDNVIADNTPIHQYRRNPGGSGLHEYVATTVATGDCNPKYEDCSGTGPTELLVAQQRTDPATWGVSAQQLMMDIAPRYFDLEEYPFVRYGAFVATVSDSTRRLCGHALSTILTSKRSGDGNLTYRLPYGRYVALTARKNGFADAAGNTRACMRAHVAGERRIGGATTHEIGHLLGLGHAGPGWVHEYQYSPNRWSQMNYGYALPLMELQVKVGSTWVTRSVPQTATNDDFPLETQQTGSAQGSPHFSKGKSMVDIDENALDEAGGLLGDGSRYVFQRIRDRWTSPTRARGGWEPEVGVTWVDWDRNKFLATRITSNSSLVRANVGISDATIQDFDKDGDDDLVNKQGNCWRRTDPKSNYTWINFSTKKEFTGSSAEDEACRDVIPGKYTVAKTHERDLTYVRHELENRATHNLNLKYETIDNETDYLKQLDLHFWSQYWYGNMQYEMVGGRFQNTYTTSDNAVASLPTEAE
jgi:hypothetical protein